MSGGQKSRLHRRSLRVYGCPQEAAGAKRQRLTPYPFMHSGHGGQATKFNEVPYAIQRGAEAVFSSEGQAQTREQVAYYMENARRIRTGLEQAGFRVFGGEHAPYIWMRTPDGLSSWEFFDELLNKAQIVGTPGSGFGPSGEGYFRLSAFNSHENVDEAISRIKNSFGS